MASLASTPDLQVFVGSWINWSRGRVLGATLTVSNANGNLLIAFIALFVAFTGTCTFRLFCFIFHQIASTSTAQDAIYNQRQAILRNSANGITATWELGRLLWAWRNSKQKAARRILPVAGFVLLIIGAFAASGVLSSHIAAMTGNEVLLRESDTCGQWGTKESITVNGYLDALANLTNQYLASAANYAQDCYQAAPSANERCGSYTQPRITRSITLNASCPFEERICRTKNENIMFDTGMIDSHAHLGINAPPSERTLLRRLYQCAPLVTEGYSQDSNETGTIYTRYYYGSQIAQKAEIANFTHIHSRVTKPDLDRLPGFEGVATILPMTEYRLE